MSRKKRPVIAIGIDGDRREYDSVWEAHEDGFHYPKIYRCLKKHSQTHKGYHWRRPAEGKQAEPPNLEEALAWIAEATKVFAELAGGGPDLFTRRGDDFRADVHICRSRILSALTSSPGKDGDSEIIEALLANEPFVFDPATNFVHADDGGAPEHGIKYIPAPGKDGGQEVEAAEVSAEFLDRLSEALGRVSWYDDSDNRLTNEQMADRLISKAASARAAKNREEMARFGSTQPASTALVERLTKALETLRDTARDCVKEKEGPHRVLFRDGFVIEGRVADEWLKFMGLIVHVADAALASSQSTSHWR